MAHFVKYLLIIWIFIGPAIGNDERIDDDVNPLKQEEYDGDEVERVERGFSLFGSKPKQPTSKVVAVQIPLGSLDLSYGSSSGSSGSGYSGYGSSAHSSGSSSYSSYGSGSSGYSGYGSPSGSSGSYGIKTSNSYSLPSLGVGSGYGSQSYTFSTGGSSGSQSYRPSGYSSSYSSGSNTYNDGTSGGGYGLGNLGIKTISFNTGGNQASQLTNSFLMNARQQLPSYGLCAAMPLPINVQMSCRNEQCEVSCPSMYSFPCGRQSLKVVCVSGVWIIRDSDYQSVPPCHASCQPPCQNNGICIEAGICKCPENYSGPFCQYKKSICAAKPPIPKNSKISCTNNVCNVECMRGFQFPDASSITNLECKDGQWIHTKSGTSRPPDCGPICTPSCANGGQCISFNVCGCTELYRGNHCQYSIDACNVTKTNFNGNFDCSYDNDEAKCKFSCPEVPGLKIDGGDINAEYKCKYSSGKYLPSPIPKCVYPPGYTVHHGSVMSSMTETQSYMLSGGSSMYGVQYTTEHERILAILAKFRQYNSKSEWWSSEEALVSPSSYSLYTKGSMNVVLDKSPKPAMCITWGGINMKTFDGLIYKAPLSCSHTMLTDKVDATFDITLKACPFGSGYGCSHTLKIYWQSVLYTFENINGTVQLKTPIKKLPIPVQVMGMKVYPVAQHIQIDLEALGLKINWDHHQYVAIQAGPLVWGKVGGLCGSLDGDYKNDLMTRSGVVAQTVQAFADAWRVEDKLDLCSTETSLELEYGSANCDPSKRLKALGVCERLLANEKLEDCIKPFNFEALLRTCVDDYCNCPNRDHPETCNCDSIAMLAKECAFKGIELKHGWRNLEICPVSCGYGRVYLPCGPDIEPTCDSAVEPTKGKCNEGCFCPEGTVQYKDACITPELCPCTMRGKEFKPESTIKKNCNTCTCKEGKWKCTDELCGARCGAIGDPHYQTFDGKRFDFMGKCSYYLLKTPSLSVEAENVACSGAISKALNIQSTVENPSCTKSVTLNYVLKNGVQTTIKIGQGLQTHINGKEITKFPKILGTEEILIRQPSSTFMTVEFPDGIKVWWDGVSRVYIDAPPSYREKTAGLCGTFNSNTQDDYLTPEGDIETAVEPFADKWRTKDTCDFLVDTTNVPHPCTTNPDKRATAEKYCAWIMEDIFQDCHWTVEPEQYYEDCLYDVCACKSQPEQCFCPILAAYGSECMRQGVKTGWRLAVKECAVKCPIGQVYDECGDSCARSCDDLPGKNTCQKDCVEGCRCPHGEYLNDKNECVPEKKCHCNYDGISFHPGYKEVRPGGKFMDICTCEAGVWECEDAEPGDEIKYPPSSELRAQCAARPYAEFSKCAPAEPKTCKNMHNYEENLEDCVPDCVCVKDYVYDTSLKKCVAPEHCSCHHAGKSYNDGEKMMEDCNVCVCQSGNWKCSTNGCGGTCSVYGDSHFTTFDGQDFDFQGACDYVLSKGVADTGDGYTITIQNVLCGTMGVTCSKSVEISLTGSVQDSLILTAESAYVDDPNKSAIKKLRDLINTKGTGAFHVYKAGVFIVVEVIPLKLQLKWDEGTRVYVKLGNEWVNKVSGLCGNYNGNSMDDMKTPSQGLETSPLMFGHSWKVQQFCAAPTIPIDACKEHPERETWAQLKCGVLKSATFKDCHGEVPVEKYLKRCIFDTCACDQGGDCECLCTSIAHYAHACSQKGVNIRWRTPHFCPMQCDPHCSEYKSCTPACAVETCDNFLDQGIAARMCNKESCIEGCHIKPCEEGMIYLNETYKECVPKSVCKPVCLVKEGKTYYEGDVTYADACSTCRCSKKKEVCSGVKCTEVSPTTNSPMKLIDGATPPAMGTAEQPKCVRGWTRWFDKDTDSSDKIVRLNDEEKLPRYDRLESIYGTCVKKYMKKIECRVVGTHESTDYMDENVFCNLENGLACVGMCHDYEIRVFCQCDDEGLTTPAPIERPKIGQVCDNVMAEYLEYPGDCHKFLHCTPKSVAGDWTYVEKTCGEYMMFNPTMNNCDHIATVQQIKPSCGVRGKEVDIPKDCPDGMKLSSCANQCEHSCHHYSMILLKRGLCQKGEFCKPGCVPANRPDCHKLGKFWRDEVTCVESDECPCMDKEEKYVQPHMPVVTDWEVCQCIDNAYTCVPSLIENVLPQTVPKSIGELEFVKPKPSEIKDLVPILHTPTIDCKPERLISLIEGDKALPNTVFNASSKLGTAHEPHKARLDKYNTGSWSPNINDQTQYLQISFDDLEPIFGVVIAGSPDFDNYVTLFKVLYSRDGESFHYVVDETEKPQLFNGPIEPRKPVKTLFKIPVEAKSVRIYPLKWHGSIAMRVELLGCGEHDAITTTTTPKYYEIIETPAPPITWDGEQTKCIDKMGVEKEDLNPKQIKASSFWSLPKPAKKPRLLDLLKLSSPVGWKPVANTPNEYVEFDFLEPRNISGFLTKGGPDGWVSGYKVLFSKNKLIWNTVQGPDGQPQIFPANVDNNREKLNYFKTPILTQYLKLVPTKWEQNINMRIEPMGCFLPYLEIKETKELVEMPLTKCFICDGVKDPNPLSENCKCNDGLYWDGNDCVPSNLCPCVENYITYPIGSKFENKECEQCVCVLGGHSSCKPKKCPPCEKDLRPVVTTGCFCKCEPCPKHQRLCPSSGDCIPELVWCNGIQDCADDEDASCKHSFEVVPEKIRNVNETIIIKCPEPVCPPKMKIRITEKKARKMSQMFTSTFSKQVTMKVEGNRMTKTKVFTSTEEFLPLPDEQIETVREENCAEFTCIPLPTTLVNKNETVVCVQPQCPINYDVELDMSTAKPGDCQKYTCVLRPTKDDVCEISGKSFVTFDGTEFKFDTCSHILARDLINSNWIVSVHLQCEDETRKICRKMITIKDVEKGAVLTIMPNMKVNFNGFEYTVQQLINSPACKASFVISQPGNTVLVVSRKGFWVLYDEIGYVKVGVSSKHIRTVDGLCGFYNGIPSDDKRTPEGAVLTNTNRFGDSWFDNKVPKDQCYPQVCPMAVQKQALALCNTIKHPTFVKCGKAVNYKQFVSKCIETTCECLTANNGDTNTCKCNILQDFVKKCLTMRPDVQLDTWRAVHQCEITCTAPLVHSDCYKRRCEPSCDTLNGDDCPIIPDACFSGCYCPEGTVRRGQQCVPVAECKDCVCDSFGTSKYFTYDRKSFNFNGNCTYLLSRDILLPGVHTFQVYVTMDDCRKLGRQSAGEHTSCAKALHILNGDHVIHIQRIPDNPKALQVFIDGFEVKKLPYKDTWINLHQVTDKELILALPETHVELKASFEDLVFSLAVPSIKYGSKMEGLCGDCNGSPDNDLMENPAKKKGRKPSKELVDVLRSWQADEPKLALDAEECLSEEEPKEECLPLPPEKDPCLLLYDEKLFGKCSMIIDPIMYVSTCQEDLCKPGSDQKGACDTLATYAKDCAKQGICLNWRQPQLCPYDCPADQVYQPCACSKTCDTIKKLAEFDAVNMNTNSIVKTVNMDDICGVDERYEGCFCPPGTVMDNGKCVTDDKCMKCDDGEHLPGDKWQKDKCTDCECNKDGKTQCIKKNCLVEENICAEGYKPQKIVSEEHCCPRYSCVPELNVEQSKICLEPLMPVCGPSQFKKQKTGPDGCPMYICECIPKEECEQLDESADLEPGQKWVKEEIGCCPTQKVVCDKSTCPKAPEKCKERFYVVTVKEEPNACCPTYICSPPQDLCIVQHQPEEEAQFTKKISESWLHPKDPCVTEMCSYGPNGSTQLITSVETCETKCQKGFTYLKTDVKRCCGDCVQTECVYEDKLYKPDATWKSQDTCTSYACERKGNMLIVSSSQETCPDVSKCPEHLLVSEGCCKHCKEEPIMESQHNCLPISLAVEDTIDLIKFEKPGHGFCTSTVGIKGFTECEGTCSSGTKYNRITFGQDKLCKCCGPRSYKTISVPMSCEDGITFNKELEVPDSCTCSPCSDDETDLDINPRMKVPKAV